MGDRSVFEVRSKLRGSFSCASREVFLVWQVTRTAALPAGCQTFTSDHCYSRHLSVDLTLCTPHLFPLYSSHGSPFSLPTGSLFLRHWLVRRLERSQAALPRRLLFLTFSGVEPRYTRLPGLPAHADDAVTDVAAIFVISEEGKTRCIRVKRPRLVRASTTMYQII